MPTGQDVLGKMEASYAALHSLSAEFTYTVNSVRRKQVVEGHARLMKPNFARLQFTRIAEPAFPSLIASDGRNFYTYVPKNFRGGPTPLSPPINPQFRKSPETGIGDPDSTRAQVTAADGRIATNRTFAPGPHDPVLAAQQASGLVMGGQILTEPARPDGRNLRLWDSLALQAFFNVAHALRTTLYLRNLSELTVEGTREINGVRCIVLRHLHKGGNIEGGEISDFEQRVFVGPDGIIHRYELAFTAEGQPGMQVMQLSNVRLNEPMNPADFTFTPPGNAN
jgi:outer membrane lipoprotein-sorting protein